MHNLIRELDAIFNNIFGRLAAMQAHDENMIKAHNHTVNAISEDRQHIERLTKENRQLAQRIIEIENYLIDKQYEHKSERVN